MAIVAAALAAGLAPHPVLYGSTATLGAFSSQNTQPSRRSNPGSVSGTVTSEDGGAALARARIIVRSAALAQPRIALSDPQGGYTVSGLPAGDYEVLAIRSGYALRGSSLQGLSLRLADGENRRGFNIVLQRAGTIPGKVMDEDGTPLVGADIEALSLRAADTRQPLLTVAIARTDDHGEFRLTGLPAGQYFVAARDPAFNNVGDESGSLRYAPTYYPGVMVVSDAEPVTVTAGRDSGRVEFRLRIIRPARVSGIMGTSDRRQLLSGAVILIPRDGTAAASVPPEDVEIQPDGRFTFRNVAPGKYHVRARAIVNPRQVMLFGSFALSVEERDLNTVKVVLAPGAILQGHVEWVSTKGTAPPNPKGLRVRAPFADGTSFGDSVTGYIAADGSFRIDGAMPGRHYLMIEGLPGEWTISSVAMQGRDILFQPADLHEGQRLHDIRIVVSDASSELAGTVHDANGRPVADALVVAMPSSTRLWSSVDPRLRTTRTDEDGRYRVLGLPVGAYQLSAVVALDELAAIRRDWLERIEAAATQVSLVANETRTLNLLAQHASALTRPVSR